MQTEKRRQDVNGEQGGGGESLKASRGASGAMSRLSASHDPEVCWGPPRGTRRKLHHHIFFHSACQDQNRTLHPSSFLCSGYLNISFYLNQLV